MKLIKYLTKEKIMFDICIMEIIILIIIVIILYFSYVKYTSEEFNVPPNVDNLIACERLANNTPDVQSYFFNPNTNQCFLNSDFVYGDMHYPYMNNTYYFTPAKYDYGKFLGEI